jgi:uncharacterized protein (TIGR00290 family)
MPEPMALSWSGGKDSALALWTLRRERTPPTVLLTVIDETAARVAHHGTSVALLRAQAIATGLPLVTVDVPEGTANEVYEQRLRDAFATAPLDTVRAVAFGDLFLADLRAYRERQMAKAGLEARFPLWQRDTHAVSRTFIDQGFRARIVSIDRTRLPDELLGSEYDHQLLARLPPDVDPCGENGEFHTCVYDGPVFDGPLQMRLGARHTGARFGWLDLEWVKS